MSENTTTKRYVRTKELAKLTGIAESSWEKRRLSGDSPPYRKISKTVLYDLDEVYQWLDSRSRLSTTDMEVA